MVYKIDYSKIDSTQLNVFSESRKRRVFVGTLKWDRLKTIFTFTYDAKYVCSKKAIPVGKELGLFQKTHISKGELFASFLDRIPPKTNPAFKDYCRAQGISADEKNPLVLLISIGRKGPSTFIFEPVMQNDFSIETIKRFRKDLGLSIHDMALAFDLNQPTLQRLEAGKRVELGTLRRIQIYLTFSEVALWQLSLTIGHLHSDVFHRLWKYFGDHKPQ